MTANHDDEIDWQTWARPELTTECAMQQLGTCDEAKEG